MWKLGSRAFWGERIAWAKLWRQEGTCPGGGFLGEFLVSVSLGLSHGAGQFPQSRVLWAPAWRENSGCLCSGSWWEEAGFSTYSKPVFTSFLWLRHGTASHLCLFCLFQRNLQSSSEVEGGQLPLSLEWGRGLGIKLFWTSSVYFRTSLFSISRATGALILEPFNKHFVF